MKIIDNVEWSLSDKIKQSGAKIVRKLAVKEVMFSKKNLRSIVFNLVSNAIKFRGEDTPVITLSSEIESNHIVLKIEDNGKGMNPKGLNKIFELYGRLHQDIEGSGIGLYLAKKIVNAAGGKDRS